jgi:hypothetical protein
VLAVFTVAFVAPKKTISFVDVALKFVPMIVTVVVPAGPDAGEKEVIVGCENPTAEMNNRIMLMK